MIRFAKKLSIALIIVTALFFIYLKFEVFKNSPKLQNYEIMPLVVLSGSMKPAVNVGDLIFIKGTNPKNIEVGDIISYRKGKKIIITHRVTTVITENSKIMYETKGDGNNVKDENRVSEDTVIGKVVCRVPYIGYVCTFIDRNSKPFLFIIPVILVIGGEIFYFLKQKYKKK